MASSVAQPLERQLAQIPGVAQMTSTSSLGSTSVTVQFDLARNIDAAANDVQAAINADFDSQDFLDRIVVGDMADFAPGSLPRSA